MNFHIIHRCDNRPIEELCLKCGSGYAMLIPHIGETFIHNNTEYEVVDVIRVFRAFEYLIQVELERREKRRYR